MDKHISLWALAVKARLAREKDPEVRAYLAKLFSEPEQSK